MKSLSELIEVLGELPKAEQDLIYTTAAEELSNQVWVPNPGPQTEAFFCAADELFYGGQAGGGKLLRISEKIPTPSGFATMGELQPGDEIFCETGDICRVVAVSEVDKSPNLYEFTFDDGSTMVSCVDHNWVTYTAADLLALTCRTPDWRAGRRAKRPSRAKGNKSVKFTETIAKTNAQRAQALVKATPRPTVRTTREIVATLKLPGGRTNHAIPVAAALKTADADFIIPPYVLGAWLGDGSKSSGHFTGVDDEIWGRIETLGYHVSHSKIQKEHHIRGLSTGLRTLGVLGAKSIPDSYLRGSYAQRLELLRGLMDTDGTVRTPSMLPSFTNTNPAIIRGVVDLIVGLGWKAHVTQGRAKLYGKDCGAVWDVSFAPNVKVFNLPRKVEKQKLATRRVANFRYIVDARQVPSEPGRCITVDSLNGMYLAGDHMVPTHNTALVLGLAFTEHLRSLILRRTNKEADGLVEDAADILGTRVGWNSQSGMWRYKNKIIELGGCQLEEDKQKRKGIPHDLNCFDEISDFTESQYVFIIGWNRSTVPGQRCRVVATGNPPTRPEGAWVVKRWAAWLDPQHHRPAQPGELRWYTTGADGMELEVEGPGPHDIGGRQLYARSRTFIPAALSDNPDLAVTNYQATLDSLPEDLRRAYRDGDFTLGAQDGDMQAIPTSWVREAQDRWNSTPPVGAPMCAMGVDVAQGGKDRTVVAVRYDGWYAPLLVRRGAETPDGESVAGLVVSKRRDGAKVIIDVGGGWGADAYANMRANGIEAAGYMGVKPTSRRTVNQQHRFFNVRTEAYWRFREALDPTQEHGSCVMLPKDQELLSDLCAPTYGIVRPNILKIESKEDLKKRLGRSPDKGDAVVMAWFDGLKQTNVEGGWRGFARAKMPKVITKR